MLSKTNRTYKLFVAFKCKKKLTFKENEFMQPKIKITLVLRVLIVEWSWFLMLFIVCYLIHIAHVSGCGVYKYALVTSSVELAFEMRSKPI